MPFSNAVKLSWRWFEYQVLLLLVFYNSVRSHAILIIGGLLVKEHNANIKADLSSYKPPPNLTHSIDLTLNKFANLFPNWTVLPISTLLPNLGGFHRILQRVRLTNRGRLLLRTPGPVPFGTCICSNVETILSWTCLVYGPFESRTSLGTSILLVLISNLSLSTHYSRWMSCLIDFICMVFAELLSTGYKRKIQTDNVCICRESNQPPLAYPNVALSTRVSGLLTTYELNLYSTYLRYDTTRSMCGVQRDI